jgi:DNA repair protein RadA/Sms
MAKPRTMWTCQQCGATSPGYMAKCPACGEWHTMVETVEARSSGGATRARTSNLPVLKPLGSVAYDGEERLTIPIAELNRVLGGGLVRGSLVLVGGDPGIGKVHADPPGRQHGR